ncbi:MAG: hypothetical protein ACI8P9_004392 [Parasphingorhabdus sp.]|jgi:hypothetical protein
MAKVFNLEAGFSLHAGAAAQAWERDKLERLCRYISRPALSEKRFSLTTSGNIRYQLKTPYSESLPHERSECFGYGEVVDVFLQKRRDGTAAKRFFKRLLVKPRSEPRKIVTDKLRSYGVAHRELIPDTIHDTLLYANNRAELSHQPTRVRERGMRKFKSIVKAQRFLNVHSAVYKLFNLGRHLISAKNYRLLRMRSFTSWINAVA